MSLDVYLYLDGQTAEGGTGIFIRENGSTREITRAEWDDKFPGREPVVIVGGEDDEVYSANITHNLNSMAREAGIYQHLWRPDELGITKAFELIEPLAAGLELLKSDRPRFEKFNPSNGWGSYDGLVAFVNDYLEACRKYPTATVQVSR